MPGVRVLRGRHARWALLPVVAAVGLAVERGGGQWADVGIWLPDLTVGLVVAGAALAAWPRRPSVAVLLGLMAGSWFLGTPVPGATFLHVGVLTHLLVTFP